MCIQANHHRCDKEFNVDDWGFVKLQPYIQGSVASRHAHKLAKRYFGPYQTAAHVRKVAYKLSFPGSARIHPVFHVSLLKFCPNLSTTTPVHPPSSATQFPIPFRILEQCFVKRNKP
nr:uncharacterized protein LOC112099113 [Ipomoea trifida]